MFASWGSGASNEMMTSQTDRGVRALSHKRQRKGRGLPPEVRGSAWNSSWSRGYYLALLCGICSCTLLLEIITWHSMSGAEWWNVFRIGFTNELFASVDRESLFVILFRSENMKVVRPSSHVKIHTGSPNFVKRIENDLKFKFYLLEKTGTHKISSVEGQ